MANFKYLPLSKLVINIDEINAIYRPVSGTYMGETVNEHHFKVILNNDYVLIHPEECIILGFFFDFSEEFIREVQDKYINKFDAGGINDIGSKDYYGK